MGILDSLLGRRMKPSPSASIRDTLFGDLPLDAWPPPESGATAFPWSTFARSRTKIGEGDVNCAIQAWHEILQHPGLESRHYLQAWHCLRQHGEQPADGEAKQVLGVVVEVTFENGLDLLASYRDHSARYYNYSGAGVVWEHPDTTLDTDIDRLLAAAAATVSKIGPWKGPRCC